MEKRISSDHEDQLPREGSKKEQPSGRSSWFINLVSVLLRPFTKQGKRKRQLKFKRTEVTKDKFIQQEFIYKEEQTTKD